MSTRFSVQRGITLIEQIMFMLIVSVGVVGLISALSTITKSSADPMRTKQMVAIAEGLLNEILHQPFTWCDPDDQAASTALSYAGCADPQNTGTHGAGESRLTGTFDNVEDYGGYTATDIPDATGNNTMSGYGARVTITPVGTALGLVDNRAALSVTVTVTHGTESFALTGYRFRYAPRY